MLDASRALRELARPGEAVIARKPHIAYYSRLASVPFPFTNTIPELAAYAHHSQARWMYVSWPEVETRPAYWHLLDTTGVMPGLRPVHATAPHPSVIYEIGPEFGQLPSWYSNDTLMSYHTARAQLMVRPDMHAALFTLGNVYRAWGKPDSARRYMEAALQVQPQDVHTLLVLGELGIEQHQVSVAQDYFERAARLQPDNVDARIGLGWTALLGGRIDEAASTWKPVIRFAEDPTTVRRMADLYHMRGDRSAEADATERYRQLMSGQGQRP